MPGRTDMGLEIELEPGVEDRLQTLWRGGDPVPARAARLVAISLLVLVVPVAIVGMIAAPLVLVQLVSGYLIEAAPGLGSDPLLAFVAVVLVLVVPAVLVLRRGKASRT